MTPDQLEAEIARLPDLELLELRQRWRDLYGIEAPVRLSTDLLVRACAYRMQERVHGGLSASARRRLREVAAEAAGQGDRRSGFVEPGTRLVREWGGEVHEVTALADGFTYRGERHRSLSQIARLITGTRWNGHLFFGLKSRKIQGRGGEGA